MKICVIGYGLIGSIWARQYAEDGHQVSVWNRSPKAIPEFNPDLASAVRDAEVLHIVVADPPAIENVLALASPSLEAKHLVIQSCTISPSWSRRFRQEFEDRGAAYVEAPFTGSKTGAETRQTVFYLGGSDSGKERASKILAPLSRKIIPLGGNEQASAIKLAMNLQIAAITLSLGEALTLARSHAISDESFFEVLSENMAHSKVSDMKKPKLIAEDYSPQFSTKLMRKDLALAVESLPDSSRSLTSEVLRIYDEGLKAGLGELDYASLIRLRRTAE